MTDASRSYLRILLKARPVPEQLADRLSGGPIDGVELFLGTADIAPDGWLSRLERHVTALSLPEPFDWVVEAPLLNLDGRYFDVTEDTHANNEVLRRTIEFARLIGAKAVVIHAVALRAEPYVLSEEDRRRAHRAALPLLRRYVALCNTSDLVPTIENVPVLTRMGGARTLFSLVGVEPGDLGYLISRVDGLRLTLDVAHAQLYLNATNLPANDLPAQVAPVVSHYARRRGVASIEEYIDEVATWVYEAHISNARGLFDEGRPYDDGDLDLDRVARRLKPFTRYLVTETYEPDLHRARFMRDAQRRLQAALRLRDR